MLTLRSGPKLEANFLLFRVPYLPEQRFLVGNGDAGDATAAATARSSRFGYELVSGKSNKFC
jgi:hypothetical protein